MGRLEVAIFTFPVSQATIAELIEDRDELAVDWLALVEAPVGRAELETATAKEALVIFIF